MERLELVVIGIVLVIQAVFDVKWKKIPLVVTGIGFFLGIVFLFHAPFSIVDVLIALLPGVCCLLFAMVSRQAIGYGDGFLLCAMGLFYSIEEMIRLLIMAFGMAGIAALILIVVFKKKRKYEMVFVPFLVAAYAIDIWIRMESGDFG